MNWQTILIAVIVAVVFIAIVVRGIINRKNGKNSCGCGCGGCSGCGMKDVCHKEAKEEEEQRLI